MAHSEKRSDALPGWIMGVQVPFLDLVVAAWIVLVVGVMASYYLLFARRHGVIATDDRAEPRPAPAVVPLQAADFGRDTPAGATYDMENFLNDEGRSLSA